MSAFESNVRMLQPEVLLYCMRYITPDRSEAESLGPPYWINAEKAYGYAQGDGYRIKFYEQPELTGEYIVADPPLLGTQPRKTDEGDIVHVPTVTVYLVLADMWVLMEQASKEE